MAALFAIAAPIVVVIIWLARLQWNISQVRKDVEELKKNFRDNEKRTIEFEIKVRAYMLGRSILDRQENKEK